MKHLRLPTLLFAAALFAVGSAHPASARTHGPAQFSCQTYYTFKGLADPAAALEAVEEKTPRAVSEGDTGMQSAHLELARLDRTVDVTFGLDGKILVVVGKLSTGDVQRSVPIANAYEMLETGEVMSVLPVSRKQEKSVMQDLLGGVSAVAVQGAEVVCELTISQ